MNLKQIWQKQQREELEKLLEWAGSQTSLATFLGVSAQVVGGWVSRGRISRKGAAKIEALTNGQFKASELRPDANNLRNNKNV